MIRHNLTYKLLALCVSLVLWTYVNAERNPHARKTLSVPIQMVHQAKGYIYDLSESEASIAISGLKTVVDSVSKEDVSASVDVAKLRQTSNVEIKARVAAAQGELDVIVEPKRARVGVEQLRWKRLPVEVKFLSAPPLGYSYSDPILDPATVSVSGKSAEVARVRKVILALPAQTANGSIDGEFDLTPLDRVGNVVGGIALRPDRVLLKLDFVEVPATKSVIISANVTGFPKYPAKVVRISVSPSSVTLQGKARSLLDVSTIATDNISIDGLDGPLSREVGLEVPDGVKLLGRSRARVSILIATPSQ